MRTLIGIVVSGWLVGCAGKTDACKLAADNEGCPECYSGDVTCSFGEFEATEGSCGDCQARSALYAALCDAEIEDDEDTIVDGTTCTEPVIPE